jgi:cyclopropane fatty-acyl-phospholipid synthase-like methyltransferase
MRLPLSRTRAKLVHQTKGLIFDAANFQKMVELREKHQLEDSMGFRGQWDEHRRFQIEMLKKQGLLPEHTFLELGCGPMTGGIPVIEYLQSGNYVGVDIRSSVLNLGWREIGKAGLSGKNPRLICSPDFASEYIADMKVDFVYSFSVLFHLNDEVLNAYFSAVSSRLKPSGSCLANVNTHLPSDQWLEFPFIKRTIDTYVQAAALHGLTTVSLGKIKDMGFRSQSDEKENPLLKFTLER